MMYNSNEYEIIDIGHDPVKNPVLFIDTTEILRRRTTNILLIPFDEKAAERFMWDKVTWRVFELDEYNFCRANFYGAGEEEGRGEEEGGGARIRKTSSAVLSFHLSSQELDAALNNLNLQSKYHGLVENLNRAKPELMLRFNFPGKGFFSGLFASEGELTAMASRDCEKFISIVLSIQEALLLYISNERRHDDIRKKGNESRFREAIISKEGVPPVSWRK